MIKHTESCLKNKTKCFPYGGFITKIFEHFRISFENKEVVQLNEITNEAVFQNSKLKVNANGLLSWDFEGSTIPVFVPSVSIPHSQTFAHNLHSELPGPSVPVPPNGPHFSDLLDLMDDMGNKIDTILDTVNRISDKVQMLSDRVNTVSDRIDAIAAMMLT